MAFVSVAKVSGEEKVLWAFVLRRSVYDYVLYKGSGKHKLRYQRAARYIFTEYRLDEAGLTFDQVCGLFGWEPEFLRRLTRKLTRSAIKKLEASRFLDDFDDNYVEILRRTLSWEMVDACTPPLQAFHYNKDHREVLKLRVTERRAQERHVSFVPFVSWDVA